MKKILFLALALSFMLGSVQSYEDTTCGSDTECEALYGEE